MAFLGKAKVQGSFAIPGNVLLAIVIATLVTAVILVKLLF